jgi:hypothetical protein
MSAATFLLPPMPTESLPPEHYRVEIPQCTAWLTANKKRHYMANAGLVRAWRAKAQWAAARAEVPMLWRVYIVAEVKLPLTRKGLPVRRRRDPANWAPTAKACVDGLVDAKILVDDSEEYVTGPDMRIGPGQADPALVLHLWRYR